MAENEVRIHIDRDVVLVGDFALPTDARGLVIFAHGSGSGRFSTRNRFVASGLQRGGFGTLLLDLLTAEEERVDTVTLELRFDIGLLGERVGKAIDWAKSERGAADLPIGLFGASTGAAAAIVAAAARPRLVDAVVSRGGRPDLAGGALDTVRAPTLLIVGGNDEEVLELNREALARLACAKELVVVPGATHLFEERGALEQVTAHAQRWFDRFLPAPLEAAGVGGL